MIVNIFGEDSIGRPVRHQSTVSDVEIEIRWMRDMGWKVYVSPVGRL